MWLLLALMSAGGVFGCAPKDPPYGTEYIRRLPREGRAIWAVAPAINLSGQREVDPLLQADLVYEQVQQVRGLTVVPVNRVAEVFAGLEIDQVQSAEQAALVCDLLGCDALLVPTVTAYDPYDPPKLGASLHLFRKSGTYARPANVDPRELARIEEHYLATCFAEPTSSPLPVWSNGTATPRRLSRFEPVD